MSLLFPVLTSLFCNQISAPMAAAPKKLFRVKILSRRAFFLLIGSSLFLFALVHILPLSSKPSRPPIAAVSRAIKPFECYNCPQAHPLLANTVEGLKFPFLYSLPSLGDSPDKPDRNVARALRGKPFRRPAIAAAVQELLEQLKAEGRDGLFLDVGAGVGMATLAAAVMGFRVVAIEPTFANVQRICDGIYLNRVEHLVEVFEAAASDRSGNILFNKEFVDKSGASSGRDLPVRSIPVDKLIKWTETVLVLRIGVQGWEHPVLKGATKLLSRRKSWAPYVIYEEDDHLLEASNSSAKEVRAFLHGMGYGNCVQHGTNAHCSKI